MATVLRHFRLSHGDWLWTTCFGAVAVCAAYAYHGFPSGTYLQTDDYMLRLWAVSEPVPWRALVNDLRGGQSFRPLSYVLWHALERFVSQVPEIHAWAMLASYSVYAVATGLLATSLSRDRWVGLLAGMFALGCPTLGRHILTWYILMESVLAASFVLLASWCVLQGVRTGERWWLYVALLLAGCAGLWQELALVVPGLVFAVLAVDADVIGNDSVRAPAPLRAAWTRWRWWLPFVVVVVALLAWRALVMGGIGLTAHHWVFAYAPVIVARQLLTLAGLVGAAPIGWFYPAAVARSFPLGLVTPAAWSLSLQLACLAGAVCVLLLWYRAGRDRRVLVASALWYLVSWIPAVPLTAVQTVCLLLPGFTIFLLAGLALRRLFGVHEFATALTAIVMAVWLGTGTARHFASRWHGAQSMRRETASLLETVRHAEGNVPRGTRIFLLRSQVLRPDLIAEVDAARRGTRCLFDLYNLATPAELVVAAEPLDPAKLRPLWIVPQGLRDGSAQVAHHKLQFVTLQGSFAQLADPGLGNRFWRLTNEGWRDVTESVYREHGLKSADSPDRRQS